VSKINSVVFFFLEELLKGTLMYLPGCVNIVILSVIHSLSDDQLKKWNIFKDITHRGRPNYGTRSHQIVSDPVGKPIVRCFLVESRSLNCSKLSRSESLVPQRHSKNFEFSCP
jgi:hypothetical protein